MKNKPLISLSIGQSILLSTMIIVSSVLLVSSVVSYAVFSSRAESLVESQSREINKQIVLNFESYIESIIETANYIQISSLRLDLLQDRQELQDLYTVNSQVKRDVVSIFLFDKAGRRLLGDRISPYAYQRIPEEPWFASAMADPAIFHFISVGKSSVALDRADEVISVAKQVSYGENGVRKVGVLLIELNFQAIRNYAEQTNLGKGGHTLIVDQDDALIFSSELPRNPEGSSLEYAASHILGGSKVRIGNHDLFLSINTLAHTRWRIATLINIDEIHLIRRSVVPILLIVFVVTLVITAMAGGLISYRISRPINQLQSIMLKIEQGAIDTEVSVSGQREIVLLGRSFNSMIEKIRDLMNRVVFEQREKRKTELLALQNQINPHFLYNSLDSIVWLAEHDRSQDVITTVIALARFFRISISRGETFISVEDEINHVRNYLMIQSIRYVDKFHYDFDIASALLSRKVLKLILQPLVENAINHGIDEEDGHITIRGRIEGLFMIFEVVNTGYGMSETRIGAIHDHLEGRSESGGGVGLKNVNQRLRLYYGEEAGVSIFSRPDKETIVSIRIPIQNEGLTL